MHAWAPMETTPVIGAGLDRVWRDDADVLHSGQIRLVDPATDQVAVTNVARYDHSLHGNCSSLRGIHLVAVRDLDVPAAVR
mgnify:FL=1